MCVEERTTVEWRFDSMRFIEILDRSRKNWWDRIRTGETFQVTGKDGSQFKTHADCRYGIPMFKDGLGKMLLPKDVIELVQIFNRF